MRSIITTPQRFVLSSLSRHIPGAINIPLIELTGGAVSELKAASRVVVIGSDDMRSQQACVRLSKVYRLPEVNHIVLEES